MKTKTRSERGGQIRTPSKKRQAEDPMLKEFLTKDLGDDLRASMAGVMVRPRQTETTSLKLDPELKGRLERAGAKHGVGYQTMLKRIAREHVADYE